MPSQRHRLDPAEIEKWLPTLGSMPEECLAWRTFDESYQMIQAHVWQLENGNYALIVEEGCSCYDPDDAQIELFPRLHTAIDAFDRWVAKTKADISWYS